MWLFFTLTILITREVVANFEVDDYDGDKSIKSDIINIIARQVLTSDLKMHAAKMWNEQDTSPFEKEYEGSNEENEMAEAGVFFKSF